ncbi:MAG: hypothetical protein U5R31_10065 [Acidimicrobiia bacterium]|nr:hypothetical protein [Acidimicrobiia bacterium]
MKKSKSSGGSSSSTTAVTGIRGISASQNAAHSHPPRCGSATMGPSPRARASRMCSKPS